MKTATKILPNYIGKCKPNTISLLVKYDKSIKNQQQFTLVFKIILVFTLMFFFLFLFWTEHACPVSTLPLSYHGRPQLSSVLMEIIAYHCRSSHHCSAWSPLYKHTCMILGCWYRSAHSRGRQWHTGLTPLKEKVQIETKDHAKASQPEDTPRMKKASYLYYTPSDN